MSRAKNNICTQDVHSHSILLDSREIFLHSQEGNTDNDPGVDYKMSNCFLKNIRVLESIDSKKPIIIHQHSIGGYWTEAMMIYDIIDSSKCPIAIVTHGVAASMGSIIPQAADLVITMPNCWWLIHDGTTGINENFTIKMAKSWFSWEDRTSKQMLDIYTSSLKHSSKFKGKSESYIKSYIKRQLEKKEDWWLSGQEAVEYRFADAVFGSEGFESIEKINTYVH